MPKRKDEENYWLETGEAEEVQKRLDSAAKIAMGALVLMLLGFFAYLYLTR